MHHIVPVAVVNPGDDLLKESARVLEKIKFNMVHKITREEL